MSERDQGMQEELDTLEDGYLEHRFTAFESGLSFWYEVTELFDKNPDHALVEQILLTPMNPDGSTDDSLPPQPVRADMTKLFPDLIMDLLEYLNEDIIELGGAIRLSQIKVDIANRYAKSKRNLPDGL